MNGLSIAQHGTFFGFSIEMSVANQLSAFPPYPLCVSRASWERLKMNLWLGRLF
ncbi:hypothetical protein BV20DRAFT_967779 [Pilatotrama ljubarskyi]|nr:hypothetical protein BV20DRAFT_967779 [Pilatotrama ljubarskyi]